MSEIKVGDVAMIKHVCCEEGQRHLGRIGTVAKIRSNLMGDCVYCGHEITGKPMVTFEGEPDGLGVPLWWLRKIEPLAEPESAEHEHRIQIRDNEWVRA